jgi:hypothetical protein
MLYEKENLDKELKLKSDESSKLQTNLDKRVLEIENLQREVKDKTDQYTQLQSDIMKVNVDLKKGIICIIIIKTKFLLFMPLVCFVPKTFELFGSANL